MSNTTPVSLPPDLEDEIISINSIYAPETLILASDVSQASLILALPQTKLSLLLNFPPNYPSAPPQIDRVFHVDKALQKGFGSRVLALARDVLSDLISDPAKAGEVILYELIESLESRIAENLNNDIAPENDPNEGEPHLAGLADSVHSFIPTWILSEPLQSHKSTFLARACPVTTPEEAYAAIKHLVTADKRAAKATHNMWAYRIRSAPKVEGRTSANIIYSDADDDGEDGAGAKLAALLQSMGAWGVLVIVSRWYGGTKLGPERWRLIGSVGRDAILKGDEAGAWIVDKA